MGTSPYVVWATDSLRLVNADGIGYADQDSSISPRTPYRRLGDHGAMTLNQWECRLLTLFIGYEVYMSDTTCSLKQMLTGADIRLNLI